MTVPEFLDVLLVEDDPAHLARYRDNLSLDPGLRVVGAFEAGRPALQAAASLLPHVALVDLGLPDIEGFDLIRELRRCSPGTDVLVVSVFGSEYHLLTAIEAGATGYLLKDSGPTDFNAAIHALHAGESPMSPSLARHLLRRCIGMAPANPAVAHEDADLLSRREAAILECVAQGESAAEIGRRLFISPHTVKTHVKNIYRKLETHSRHEAVRVARQRGLIHP
ncbi:MAG: response regulator transcription factor [Ramlibacter sp.]|nr:response regulator transcription factor [Ramlibacter sp.]